MVHAMKMGWMKTPSQRKKELEEKSKEEVISYDLWSNEDLVCSLLQCIIKPNSGLAE